ncbi:MAG: response regulator [Anaerolineae bacterium]
MSSNVPIRLLIVDDHIIMREGLAQTLTYEPDFEVVGQASNGRDGISLVRQLKPDIILLDITMKDMTGLDVAQILQEEAHAAKIIFLTMHDDTQFFFEALRVGASGYVLKGSRTTVLLAAIRAVHQGGVYLSPMIATELVQDFLQQPDRSPDDNPLTDREKEVLTLIARGLTNQKIADYLSVSINTIKTHRLNIYQKLNLRDKDSLIHYALSHGLVHPSQVS